MKLRVYLDTSVLSALFDTRMPERQLLTQEFWVKRTEFELGTSDVCCREIGQVRKIELRTQLETAISEIEVKLVNDEIRELANNYIVDGAFSPAMIDDALHVASAVYHRYDVLLSWNFRHLVNRRRRAAVMAVNAANGIPAIDILAPPEL